MVKNLLLPAFFIMLFLSCKKEEKRQDEYVLTAVGNWGLQGESGLYLYLNEDGSIGKRRADTVLSVQYNRYKILGDSIIHFYKPGGDSIIAKYYLEDRGLMLHLSGACIYDCEEWFGRMGSL
ncbi:MAG: hypothetical protein QM763_22125 [Agriterribacter sp.]